ncbi:MAG: hypothetical protein JW892_03790 [Anaerolineae bacterium]|nr:hypothetical protein [Anaerolineae bacterium]
MGMVWTEEHLSAYLDQQLPLALQRELEADLARDVELQQRVALLQQTVALVQNLPLREPPRNYLLTPAMVAAPLTATPAPPRRSLLPVWLMRLATVVSAAVFVLAVGLNLNPGLLPITRATDMAQRQVELVVEEVQTEPALSQEAPVAADSALPEGEDKAMSRAAPVPAPPANAEDGAVYGLGGGFEEGYTGGALEEGGMGGGLETEQAFAPVVPGGDALPELCAVDDPENCANTAPTAAMKSVEMFTATALISETEVPEIVTLGAEMTPEVAPVATAVPETVAAPTPSKPLIPLWATVLLGVGTLGLCYFTWRLSHRR